MKGFFTLASGSKGNAFYLGSEKARILVDAGLSLKVIKERLETYQIPMESLDAIFVTHEHSDHIKGLEPLIKQYDLPVITNHETAKQLLELLDVKPRLKLFCTGEPFQFKDIGVHPFSIPHDTVDPVGFVFQIKNAKIGLCTDLGHVPSHVVQALKGCDFLIAEANHDEEMVMASSRPQVYKQRVLSKMGHLSNSASAMMIQKVYHPGLKRVFLAHLSDECNEKNFALKTVQNYLEENNCCPALAIAEQEAPSDFQIID